MGRRDARQTPDARGIAECRANARARIAYVVAVACPILITIGYVFQRSFWGSVAPLLCLVLVFNVTAAFGGLRPTALATVLGIVSAALFCFPPFGVFAIVAPADRSLLALLGIVGGVTGALGERCRHDRRAARRAGRRAGARDSRTGRRAGAPRSSPCSPMRRWASPSSIGRALSSGSITGSPR